MFKLGVTNGILKSLSLNRLPCCLIKKKLPNIELKIEGNILVKNEFNYLGVYFQTNGTYNKHTKYVSDRCSKRKNILRYVKNTSWGVSKEPMLALYSALIRSVV